MSDTMSFDDAVQYLPEGESVHTFMDGGVALLGADWERDDLLTAMRAAPEILITGPAAQGMRHGLAIFHPRADANLFIETVRRTDEADVATPTSSSPSAT